MRRTLFAAAIALAAFSAGRVSAALPGGDV
jgi:hypothetical protein